MLISKKLAFIVLLSTASHILMYSMDWETCASTGPEQDNKAAITQTGSSPSAVAPAQSNLDLLPSRAIGNILHHLNNETGTRGFINEKDLPVVLKNVRNLALVNKRLSTSVNSELATQLLTDSLSQRFQKSSIDIAAFINTEASRRWLKNYLHRSGEYDLFKIVQKIFTICREIREQAKQFDVNLQDGQEGWPDVNPCHYQTRQGLMLKCESYPDSLITPWGKVALFGGGCGTFLGFLFLQQEFLKKVTAHFKANTQSIMDRERVEHYELKKQITQDDIGKGKFNDHFEKISKNDLAAKKDTQTMIISSHCGWGSVYALQAVGPVTLPNPELTPYCEFRSYDTSKLIWKIMDDEFHGKSSKPSDTKKPANPLTHLPKKPRIYPAPYELVPSIKLETIDDAPLKYMRLLEHLTTQPLFSGEGCIVESAQVIPCEDWDDCRIAEILAHNANQYLNDDAQKWRIHTFGCGNSQLYLEDIILGNGLQRWIYENDSLASASIIRNHFETTINKLQNGWRRAALINNQDILHTESEEEWFLFVKESNVIFEDTLIRFFAGKFKLTKEISCHDAWHNRDSHRDKAYLWIRKDAIEEVTRVFGFNLA